MYFKKYLFQISKCLLTGLILVQLGCKRDQPAVIKLDSALETHFQRIQEDQSGSARVRLRQYMDKNGESSDALFLMGLSYHQDRQYSKAAEWFRKGISVQNIEIYPQTWHFLGWSYFYLGELEQSRMAFEQFLLFQPNEADSLFALGLIATEEGNLQYAQQLFHQSSDAASDVTMNAKATARWADVEAALGDWERALRRAGQVKASDSAHQEFVLARQRVRPDLDSQTRFPE